MDDIDRKDDGYIADIRIMVDASEDYRDHRADERLEAMALYDGDPEILPYEEGRSKAVSRDVRAGVNKVSASVKRVLLGNDEIVQFNPLSAEDEEGSQQAADYVNYVVLPECDGRRAIEDAIDDALKLRNGILTWYHDETLSIEVSEHTNLDEQTVQRLTQSKDVEVLESESFQDFLETPTGIVPINFYNIRIRRQTKKNLIRLESVAPEEFLIHPSATSIEDSPLTGRKTRETRSDLIAMGFDREQVEMLPADSQDDYEEAERLERRDEYISEIHREQTNTMMEEVDYYDLYVRIDLDDDGIAELYHFCFGGRISEDGLLMYEECDEVPFADLTPERVPHEWEGVSIVDDLKEIQYIKSALLRSTLDNAYWVNNKQVLANERDIENWDEVINPSFGGVIKVRGNKMIRDVYQQVPIDFTAAQTFQMMEYMDTEGEQRTGISDASAGLSPDALQNQTATATALLSQGGLGRTEQIVRTMANGLARAFKGILKLVIKHQDQARTIRLRNQWVQMDPRQWNAGMDATVNIGLGAGTRERDIQAMQFVMNLQREIIAAFGKNNPFVKPENLYNSLVKSIESAGLRSPNMYITKPDPQEIQQMMEAEANKPDPEQQKLQLEQAKMQQSMQLEQLKAQRQVQKEQAQLQADLQTEQARLAAESEARAQELQVETTRDREKAKATYEIEQMKLAAKQEIEEMKIQAQFELEQIRRQDSERAEIDNILDMAMEEDGVYHAA